MPTFLGGGITKTFVGIPQGWSLASAGRPSADFVLAQMSAFRTTENEYVKLFRWKLRPEIAGKLRERAEKLRLELLQEDAERIVQQDRKLLFFKNLMNRTPAKQRGKRSKSL